MMCPELSNRQTESGASLLETVLALAMFGALFGLTNAILSQESQRQQSIILGRELGFMTGIMQDYVGLNYGTLQKRLLSDGADGLLAVTMAEIAAAGFLPTHLASAKNSFDQAYLLLIRGVNRTDRRSPQVTLQPTDLDQDADMTIDPAWLDNTGTNGELDLEAVLVTTGGTPVAPVVANPAVIAAERFSAGSLAGTIARGPYGVWELDMIPYSALSHAPWQGHFAAIIAASGLYLRDAARGSGPDFEASGDTTLFDRCPAARADVLALCLNDNRIYTSIVFNATDDDGDGTPDRFGRIADVYAIDMGRPVDADDDGQMDTFSAMTGLAELSCGDGTPAIRTEDGLAIVCPKVRVSGQTTFDNDATVSGDLDVDGIADAWRFRAGALGSQDLTKGLFFADIVAMNASVRVSKPDCRDQGSSAQIYAAPVSYLNRSGEPVLGVRAEATDHSTYWSVTMSASIDRDSDGDGLADVITLNSASDHALVLTRCN